MTAFVPSVSVPLRSANSFVGAVHPAAPRHAASPPARASPVSMSDGDDKPKRKISLPSIKLPFGGKKKAADPAAAAPAKPAAAVAPKANVLVKGEATISVEPPKPLSPTNAPPPAPADVRSFPKEYQFLADRKILNQTCYDMRIIAPTYFYTEDKQGSKNQTFNDLDVYTDNSFWEHPGGWPREQANIAIDACLKQLFGTSKLVKSDLKSLTTSILCVKQTGNLREFIREVGQSDLYRSRFFEPNSNLRFIELNFKHFLGRAPRGQKEVSEHVAIITKQGYEAEINSYIDSDEYQTLYGFTRIPSVNFDSRFPFNQDMNRTAVLNGAFVTPDTLSKSAFLTSADIASFPALSIAKGLPSGWKSESQARARAVEEAQAKVSPLADDTPLALAAEELRYRMKFGETRKFWYKDSIAYDEIRKMSTEPMLEHSEQEEAEAEAILKFGSSLGKMYAVARE